MAKYVIEDTILTNTANAIREKKGKTEPITPSNFATEIAGIQSGSTVTKGIIFNEWDDEGYALDISVVGMTSIPVGYFYNVIKENNNEKSFVGYKPVTVHLPTDLIKIEDYAFRNCNALNITELPNSLTNIGMFAFEGCSDLNLTKLPELLNAISSYCFSDCVNLALTELPKNLSYISNNAFYYCYSLALTELPENLSSIGEYSFYSCENITIDKLPIKISKVPKNAFSGCSSIESLNILGDLTSIGNYAFSSCSGLNKFILQNVTAVSTLGTGSFQNTPIASGTGYIYVPDNLVDSYKSATNWSTYANQIKPISELEGN